MRALEERRIYTAEKNTLGSVGENGQGRHTKLEVGRLSLPWIETQDFPVNDPWSIHTREVIKEVKAKGGFKGNFFERTENGVYLPIPAKLAEARRAESEQNGGRDKLNIYHHLSVYHLQPGSAKIYGH